MIKKILDTSILLGHWQRCRAGRRLEDFSIIDVQDWARELIELRQTNRIVAPVEIEMLAGVTFRYELQLTRAFLDMFVILDERRIPEQDWSEARRLAQRVPRDGQPRQLGDWLIRAIANRLRHDVDTFDSSFPG
jgi:hypothetical protein